ncbi:hypothetical protein J2J97_32445 (plasmid) [Rhizobium bangladeshense]|uniref:hypothetical protein n=1 Tax=Rhizobium bangladeshense TaxID=1138189 RepID=UPI001A97E96D|nr:hypothetical protein [Rhizobium bangladeshense]QSY98616.1 hypothetical protein J2J97_32445 [Rhizobium bangladeshense]
MTAEAQAEHREKELARAKVLGDRKDTLAEMKRSYARTLEDIENGSSLPYGMMDKDEAKARALRFHELDVARQEKEWRFEDLTDEQRRDAIKDASKELNWLIDMADRHSIRVEVDVNELRGSRGNRPQVDVTVLRRL